MVGQSNMYKKFKTGGQMQGLIKRCYYQQLVSYEISKASNTENLLIKLLPELKPLVR